MKALHPSRTFYVFSGIGAALLFLLGAAAWHAIIQADPPGCTENELACLFIPTRSDYPIHLVSYALTLPLMAALFFWFSDWRKQWARIHLLTANLETLAVRDEEFEAIAASLGLQGKVILANSDDFFSFCACCLSPRIFISRGVVNSLTSRELTALLLHEKWHLENRDPLKVVVGHLLVSALFFGPLLRDLFKRYLIRMEIAADQYAIACQGRHQDLILALKKLLDHEGDIRQATLAAGGTEALSYRINFTLGRASTEPIPLSHIAFAVLFATASLAAIIIPLASLHF